MKKSTGLTSAASATAIVFASLAGAAPALAAGQNGTTLKATVTAEAHHTLTYGWTIDKSVSPSSVDMFVGDTAAVDYTVAVTRDGGTPTAWLAGQVCVTNGGAVPTENLSIGVSAMIPPSTTSVGSSTVDVSALPVLRTYEKHCYDYRINIANPVAGANYKVTSDVTITNHSGHLGEQFGPGPSASTAMPATATPVNASVDVLDTNGMSWTANGSERWTYPRTFDAAGTFGNTATITQTGQSASADVDVNVYQLSVAKTADTSWTRDWTWAIDKSVDKSALDLKVGESAPLNWTVAVAPTKADSGYKVSGTITVTNPAPMAATLTSVTDTFGDLGIDVSCGSLTVPANGSLDCTYTKALDAAIDGTNTATATQQNHAYASNGTATATGTTAYNGTAVVTFSATPATETDECVNVTDTLQGTLGRVCSGDETKSFGYLTTAGPYAAAGTYTIANTATFTTNDTGATGHDDASVTVNVTAPITSFGCTYTQGYWKNHTNHAAWAPYRNGKFFQSGQTWLQVFNTSPKGNGYYILAVQYMAATMSIDNGASSIPEVDAALAGAKAFFATAKPTATLTSAQKAQLTGWATTLDNFNNGVTGPGHCG